MPSSRMSGECPVPSHWQEGSCLCGLKKPLGDRSAGAQLSAQEAWVFPKPKYLPSVTKKLWQLPFTLKGALYFEGRGQAISILPHPWGSLMELGALPNLAPESRLPGLCGV